MEEINSLINILPIEVKQCISDPSELVEVIMDFGRPLTIRSYTGNTKFKGLIITKQMIQDFEKNLGKFGPDNRAGINGTLHRISKIRNKVEETVGFTCRVGRTFDQSVNLVKDIVASKKNILIVGKPGSGKSSLLRSIANFSSTQLDLNVVIVDSSNEIAGDGDVPHPAVGDSRRLQVPDRDNQHNVMIEAVENHMPQVVIVDEISTDEESKAARTIAQRGVQLIATSHGLGLKSIMENPPLKYLIGGVKSITVGDRLAETLGKKQILERAENATFEVVIEIKDFNTVCIYEEVQEAVDCILSNKEYEPETRTMENGVIQVYKPNKLIFSSLETTPLKNKLQEVKLRIQEEQNLKSPKTVNLVDDKNQRQPQRGRRFKKKWQKRT